MLISLHIKNVAVIDEVSIDFCGGFNVLTGETGAGKSIIIDSLNMVLGQRTSKELIRSGQQKAVAQALFYIDNEEAVLKLKEFGLEAEDNNLLIYRDLSADGKGICRINGMMATAGMVKEISKYLVNIHGQQDNQALLSTANHVDFLDRYAGIIDIREKYRALYNRAKEIRRSLDEINASEQEKARRTDLLQYQINEIESARLKKGEEEELAGRLEFLSGAGKIASVLEHARQLLYAGSESSLSVHDILSGITEDFGEIAKYEERLSSMYEMLNSIRIDLDEVTSQIRDYAGELEFDPGELARIEERLDLIYRLGRKYGEGTAKILEFLDNAKAELDSIVSGEEYAEKLKAEYEECVKSMEEYARQITNERKKAAETLENGIMAELAELDMPKVKFKADVKPGDFTETGADRVEFLISTNAGEPPRPLAKIASGGEMSRIMLAIKCILADTDNVSTLIFDEIDSGISGRAAVKIGQKLCGLADKKQILCITHLAQIASMANEHFLIEKDMTENITATKVTRLSDSLRVKELARIMGGAAITDITLKNAEEMLQLAKKYKSEQMK